MEEASGETNITIVDDDRKPCVNHLVPNKEIMDNFQKPLDHHPMFKEEHKEVVTQSNKRQKKIHEGDGVL